MKWGNCHEKSRRKRVAGVSGFGGVVVSIVFVVTIELGSGLRAGAVEEGQLSTRGWSCVGQRLPPVAVHPMRGVSPPTTDPTQVLITENRFMGVYTAA